MGSGAEALEAVRGREDRDSLIAAERLQIVVAGDDRLGASSECTGEDVQILGVAAPGS